MKTIINILTAAAIVAVCLSMGSCSKNTDPQPVKKADSVTKVMIMPPNNVQHY